MQARPGLGSGGRAARRQSPEGQQRRQGRGCPESPYAGRQHAAQGLRREQAHQPGTQQERGGESQGRPDRHATGYAGGARAFPQPPRAGSRTGGMGDLTGRIGGAVQGYDLDAHWDGERITGRIGGRFQGKDLRLTCGGGQVEGRIGGQVHGFSAVGELSPARVQVRLGGRFDGDDVELTLDGGRVTGRFSGRLSGKDVDLTLHRGHLRGRIGGVFEGKDVELDVQDTPAEVAALAAVCAYKVLEDDEQASAAGASSGA